MTEWGNWQDYAACQGVDSSVFFEGRTSQALEYCSGCLVRVPCLQMAVDNGLDFGVFGGKTAEERADMRERQARDRGCGTVPGYKKHRRLGEEACEACLAANREYLREYRDLKRRQREYAGELSLRRGA